MDLFEYIRKSVIYQVENGNRDFVIYPFGEKGKYVKKILNEELGIQERYVVDNILHNGKEIQSVKYLKENYERESFKLLLAADYKLKKTIEIHQQIEEFITLERLVDVGSPSLFFNPWNYFEEITLEKNLKYSVVECIQREVYKNGVKGAVAEAGVYKGKTAKRINYMFPDRKLYLFDTFTGFDEKEQKVDDLNNRFNMKIDFSDTSVDIVMSEMMFPGNCVIKKGYFPESAEDVDEIFSFVRLDMDLYEPIKAGLEFFYPRMSRGGYIAVHDCRSKNFDGARMALLDFCREKKLSYMNMQDELGTAVIPIAF